MSKVRQTSWGCTPVFAVDHVDDRGELREATFFDRREAEAFAAEQGSGEHDPPTAEREDDSWVQGVLDAVGDVPRQLAEASHSGRR